MKFEMRMMIRITKNYKLLRLSQSFGYSYCLDLFKNLNFSFSMIVFCSVLVFSCENKTVNSDDPDIVFLDETVFYMGKPFTGKLVDGKDPFSIKRITPFVGGKIDGIEKDIHPNGRLSAERKFSDGKRVGLHRGWYPNGNLRFEASYALSGKLHGKQKEWYESGKPYTYTEIKDGEEVGKKIWREDGQLYANYVFKDGRIFGLTGGKLCNQIRGNQNGETNVF
ncbi:hypothetical protein P3G55_02450 [Leptospira sp. 96542]|nr:hypothetical protein [Leptospira sp. 96542]